MKTAFVTGANKGIGFEISKKLLKEGYHVLVGSRDENRGKKAIEALSAYGLVDLVTIDISDKSSITAAVNRISNEFKDLELLFNNAGISGGFKQPGWSFTREELLETYTVDFLGPFELSKGLLPNLIENHGKIINVTIPIEPFPIFNPFAYQTSKAPLNVMTKSWGLSIEEMKLPIQIFGVMPGAVSTDLNNHITGEGVKTAEEAADWIVRLALDDRNHNGQVINNDGMLADYYLSNKSL
jgi:NAD(P)-dependent dehydrogenase (short-subunit alcohol dehydrogenase family)